MSWMLCLKHADILFLQLMVADGGSVFHTENGEHDRKGLCQPP